MRLRHFATARRLAYKQEFHIQELRVKSLLRYIAAGLDVSYESLSRDYSKTNYSGFKAGDSQVDKGVKARKKRVADRQASWGFRLWLEEAINSGEITSMSKKAPPIYEGGFLGTNFDAYSACDWIGGGRGQVDELKETQAAIQRILFGLSTHEAELGRLGKDWRKVYRQMAREQGEAKKLDILQTMASDMANATTGASNTKSEPGQATTLTGAAGGGSSKTKSAAQNLVASMRVAALQPAVDETEEALIG